MDLRKLAQEFADLATSKKTVSVVENSDQILQQLSDLKEFEDRVEFAREHFEELGEGSSRTIFLLSPSLVLKVAHNDAGLAQNTLEANPKLQNYPCLNPTLIADSDGKWVIVKFTDTLTVKEFEALTGLNFTQFGKAIHYRANNEIHSGKPQKYEEIVQHPLFKCLFSALMDVELQAGDAIKISSWGKDKDSGKPVLRDYGLNKQIWAEFYEDDANNSTDTP